MELDKDPAPAVVGAAVVGAAVVGAAVVGAAGGRSCTTTVPALSWGTLTLFELL